MTRIDRAMSPAALVLSLLSLVLAVGAGSAYAAAKITTNQIKDGAITTAKIKGSAVTGAKVKDKSLTAADLSPGTVTALKGTPTYWAYVNQSGTAARGSAGVSAEVSFNGGYYQYRITFPRDVSACGYQVTTGDTSAIGSNEYVVPTLIGVARSTQGPRVLAVSSFDAFTGNSIQDNFFIAVTC